MVLQCLHELPVGIELSCPECPPNRVPKILRTVERKAERNFEQIAENVLLQKQQRSSIRDFLYEQISFFREGMKVRIVAVLQSKTTNKRASPKRH